MRINHLLIQYISIHALREEGDVHQKMMTTVSDQFLSTPSARRATLYKYPP